MTAEEISQYWALVWTCLVDIYHLPPDRATLEVDSLRQRLAVGLDRTSLPKDLLNPDEAFHSPANSAEGTGVIYHSAPIHVASDLAAPYREIDGAMWKRWQEIERRSHAKVKSISAVTEGHNSEALVTQMSA